jgi:outer membrane protein assembly factor BamB
VLVATDRGGVLASNDGGTSFAPANQGFSGRKVEALLADRDHPARLYAGVVNDKSFGGVFVSSDGGFSWRQTGAGLEGRDVFVLAQAADGTVLAGTSHGIFALEAGTEEPLEWRPRNIIANTGTATAGDPHINEGAAAERQANEAVIRMESRVTALDLSGDVWLAADSIGLVTSRDQGATWQNTAAMGGYLSVAVHGPAMAAARQEGVILSEDAGATWLTMGIPAMVTRIERVAFSADGTLWLGAREGVFLTRDLGKTWLWIERLPFRDVDDVYYAASMDKVLVSSRSSDQVYLIDPKTLKWEWRQPGYRIGLIRAGGDRLVAASLSDGVLVEPPPAPAAGQK